MKKILKKITEFISKLFDNTFEVLKKHSGIAVKITDTIKNVVENKATEFIITLTPTDYDNKVLALLKKYVPQVAFKLAVIHGILQESDTKTDAIGAIVEHLKTLAPDARISFWVMFAGELNMALADGKINLAEAIALSQFVYNEMKSNKTI